MLNRNRKIIFYSPFYQKLENDAQPDYIFQHKILLKLVQKVEEVYRKGNLPYLKYLF